MGKVASTPNISLQSILGWLQICGFRHFNNIGHYTFDTVTLNNVVRIDWNQPMYGCHLVVRQAFSYSNSRIVS